MRFTSSSSDISTRTAEQQAHVRNCAPRTMRGIFMHKKWYTREESNLRHLVPETSALSTELRVHLLLYFSMKKGRPSVGRPLFRS